MQPQQPHPLILWSLRSAATLLVCYQLLRLAERFWGLGRTPLRTTPDLRLAHAEARVADVAPRYLSPAEAMQDTELRDYAAQDMKIHAIKRYRELTGAGLKEAKDTVETHLF